MTVWQNGPKKKKFLFIWQETDFSLNLPKDNGMKHKGTGKHLKEKKNASLLYDTALKLYGICVYI